MCNSNHGFYQLSLGGKLSSLLSSEKQIEVRGGQEDKERRCLGLRRINLGENNVFVNDVNR